MELAALIVSIISILLSFAVTAWQIAISIKVNKINLKSSVCEKIFDNYLIQRIPDARRFISFDKMGKFVGADKLIETIKSLIKDSLYFRYNDRKFYDELTEKLENLENVIVDNMDKKIDNIKQNDLTNNIEKLIADVYEIIENKKVNGWLKL